MTEIKKNLRKMKRLYAVLKCTKRSGKFLSETFGEGNLKVAETEKELAELRERYDELIGALPAEEKAAVLATYVRGQPLRRVAMELSVSEMTVRRILDRAENKIREGL